MVSLMKRTFQIISVAFGAALLSGCASLPETSRSASSVSIPQPGSITALQRQFQAQVPFQVNFGFDEDTLDAEAMDRLDLQADWIIDHPNVKFRVYGHTDRVGNVDYNADLGMRRAQRVVDYLVSKGVEEDRLEAMLSFGEENPLIDTEARERMNRRAETEVHEYIVPPTSVPEDGDTRLGLILGLRRTPDNSPSDPFPTSDTPTIPESPSDEPAPVVTASIDTTSNDDSSTGPSSDDTTPTDTSSSSDTSDSDTSSSDTSSDDTSSGDTSSDNTSSGGTSSDDTSSSDTSSDDDSNGGGSKANSGRGNGDEDGDPGKSAGKNNGGDEV